MYSLCGTPRQFRSEKIDLSVMWVPLGPFLVRVEGMGVPGGLERFLVGEEGFWWDAEGFSWRDHGGGGGFPVGLESSRWR